MAAERSVVRLEVLLPLVTVVLVVVVALGVDVAASDEVDARADLAAAVGATEGAGPASVTVVVTCDCSTTTKTGVVDLASGAFRFDEDGFDVASDGERAWIDTEGVGPYGLGSWVPLEAMSADGDALGARALNPVAVALDLLDDATTVARVDDHYVAEGPDGTVTAWVGADGRFERLRSVCPDSTTDVTFDAYGRDEVELPAPDEVLTDGVVAELEAEIGFGLSLD